MRVLVTAATKHGATSEVATVIAEVLNGAGVEAVALHPSAITTIEDYDAVILGSAVYVGHWLDPARRFAERFGPELTGRPVWLFSSGPIGAPAKPEEEPLDVAALMGQLGAREHRVFAGLVDRTRLGLAERAIVAAVRAPDGDFRPWPEIRAWAAGIAKELRAPVAAG